jgi:hypothetical protein
MRAIRAVAVAAALVALDVSAATAQSTRGFNNSWFWGVKAGGHFYQVQSEEPGNAFSLLGGADWLITRERGGLYVSFDHTFFSDKFVLVNDSLSPIDTVARTVFLSGMRRFTMAGMLFPYQRKYLQTYFGLGATLNQIAKAEPVGTYRNRQQETLVTSTVRQFRTNATPIVMLGSQLRLLYASAFAQATFSPASSQFFLFTGNNWRTTVEAGLRYNIGSSIDPLRTNRQR